MNKYILILVILLSACNTKQVKQPEPIEPVVPPVIQREIPKPDEPMTEQEARDAEKKCVFQATVAASTQQVRIDRQKEGFIDDFATFKRTTEKIFNKGGQFNNIITPEQIKGRDVWLQASLDIAEQVFIVDEFITINPSDVFAAFLYKCEVDTGLDYYLNKPKMQKYEA